jgi:transposase, IS5 family
MDATCVPTDLTLLNEAWEKTEKYIDILYEPLKNLIDKPCTYRKVARAEYLATAKKRKPGKKQLRKAIRKQLSYVCRNMKHIEQLQGY